MARKSQTAPVITKKDGAWNWPMVWSNRTAGFVLPKQELLGLHCLNRVHAELWSVKRKNWPLYECKWPLRIESDVWSSATIFIQTPWLKMMHQHPDFNSRCSNYQFQRRSKWPWCDWGLNIQGSKRHTFTKFCIWDSLVHHYSTSPMMVNTSCIDCRNHQTLRAETGPADTQCWGRRSMALRKTSSTQQHMSDLPEFLSHQTMKKNALRIRIKHAS